MERNRLKFNSDKITDVIFYVLIFCIAASVIFEATTTALGLLGLIGLVMFIVYIATEVWLHVKKKSMEIIIKIKDDETEESE